MQFWKVTLFATKAKFNKACIAEMCFFKKLLILVFEVIMQHLIYIAQFFPILVHYDIQLIW